MTPGAFLAGSIVSDSAEKVVVSESSTTLPYGRAATNINDLQNLVGFLDVFSGTLRRGC